MEAPFKPGDKVVCISAQNIRIGGGLSSNADEVYIVDTIWYCCEGAGFRLTLVGWPCPAKGIYCCGSCGDMKGGEGWNTDGFRKVDDISDHTTDSLLEELSEPLRELEPA